MIILNGQVIYGGGNAAPPTPAPIVSVVSPLRSLVQIDWTAVSGASYIYQTANDSNFTNPEQSTTNNTTVSFGDGITPNDDFWFRVRANVNGKLSEWSPVEITIDEPIQAVVTNLIATPQIQAVRLDFGLIEATTVKVETSTDGITYTQATASTASPYTATGLTNDINYFFRVTPNVPNIDYEATSSIVQATPTGTPQLATPTSLNLTDLSGGDVEATVSEHPESGVTYVIERDGNQVYSGTNRVATISGFIANTAYVMRVKVTKTGFDDSEWLTQNYTYQPVEGFDLITDFGVEIFQESYYGILTITPLGNGTSRITRSGGEPFTNDFVGKTFESFRIHQNPSTYPATGDNYVPNATTVRYSEVTTVESATALIVNFEYNGGNLNSPQASVNTSGQFFADNRAAFENYVNNPNRQENVRWTGVVTMKGFPNCNVTKSLIINDLNGTKQNVYLKFYWSDSFNVEEFGNNGCPSWLTNFNTSRVFNFGNAPIDINLPQILPTFFMVASVQYITPAVDLFYDTGSVNSTATGVKKTYNWQMHKERNEMPSIPEGASFMLPNMGYCVGGGTDDGTDVTAFNIYEFEGGWSSLSPMNFKAKFRSGILFKIYGTPQQQAKFIEREDMKGVRYDNIQTRWNNNREIEVNDALFTFFMVANTYWTGGVSNGTTAPNIVEVDGWEIRYQNSRDFNVENISRAQRFAPIKILLFDRIPAQNDTITLGYGDLSPFVSTNVIRTWGWSVQVGDVLEIGGQNFTVTARQQMNTPVHIWQLTLNGTPDQNATTATVVTSQTEYLLDGQFRSANHVYQRDANAHLMYTDQETNMDWEYVDFFGYIRATGEADNTDDLFRKTQLARFKNVRVCDQEGQPSTEAQRIEYNPTSLRRRQLLTGDNQYRVTIEDSVIWWTRPNDTLPQVVLKGLTELISGIGLGEPRIINPVIESLQTLNSVTFGLFDGYTLDMSGVTLRGQLRVYGNGTLVLNNFETIQDNTAQVEIVNPANGMIPIPPNLNIEGNNGISGFRITGTYPIGTLQITLTNWQIVPGNFNNSGFTTNQNTSDPNYCDFISINNQCLPL